MENCQSYTAVKKGSKCELGNYRPISVLPLVSKVLEKTIYQQLHDYLQENRLLNTYQSGFRSLHSTTTALLETTNNWSININNGLLNGVLFIDLEKAFDTINHEIISRKLARNERTHPNLVSQARVIEIFCEDCKLAAPLALCRGFGPRSRVNRVKSAWPATVPLETTCEFAAVKTQIQSAVSPK